jgi:hypothetical protein
VIKTITHNDGVALASVDGQDVDIDRRRSNTVSFNDLRKKASARNTKREPFFVNILTVMVSRSLVEYGAFTGQDRNRHTVVN